MCAKRVNITHIHADNFSHDGQRCAIGWQDDDGFRYHIWVRLPGVQAQDKIIYKNPAVADRHSRRSETRRLDATIMRNRVMLEVVLAEVKDKHLISRGFTSQRATEAAEEAKRQADYLAKVCNDALMALGRAGANADMHHPGRRAWEGLGEFLGERITKESQS